VSAALALALAGWMVMGVVTGASFGAEVIAATGIMLFVGGLETVILNVVPIGATDGGTLWRWRRKAWVAFALLAAFLAWHVLLGGERSYFDNLRETGSVLLISICAVYSVVTVGLWWYFRRD
jgi:NADH:ubiquinone oxidoreductase subunit 6 (subunit J)